MQESSNSFVSSPFGLAIIFAILWCGICFVTSFISGWYTLSRRFCRQSEPYGDNRSAGPFFYTIYTRFWSRYSSIIRLTAADDALYLSVLFFFRIAHPPLRIPWAEIKIGKTKYFWRPFILLTLGERERIPMRIPARMARKLGIMDRLLSQDAQMATQPSPIVRQ